MDHIFFSGTALDDLAGDQCLDAALDIALHRTGAIDRIHALCRDQAVNVIADLQMNVFLLQPLDQLIHELVRDLGLHVFIQGIEDDDLIDTVDELWLEITLDLSHVLFFSLILFKSILTAQVARHDEQRVLEVDRHALGICDPAIIQDLQQHIEDIRMCLFHFIEQDDGVRIAAYGLGQLTALIISDISRRSADQTSHAVLFHIFAHIDAHDMGLTVKQLFSQCLGHLGLAYAGRTQEQKAADRAILILDLRLAAQDGVCNQLQRLILTDDPLSQRILQA